MSKELDMAIEAANAGTKVLLDYYNKGTAGEVENKGKVDRVSAADIESEKVIREILEKNFPNYSMLGEELGENDRKSEYMWYVDPLCGSNDFIRGFPDFGLSIALVKDDEVEVGVCSLPAFNEVYWAERGNGAFMNGKSISVSKVNNLNDTIITTHISAKEQNLKSAMSVVSKIAGYYLKVPGSFPSAVCNLARGRSDIHVELNVGPIHRLAATMIAVEAGGRSSKLDGSKSSVHDDEILVTNGVLHEDVVKMLNS